MTIFALLHLFDNFLSTYMPTKILSIYDDGATKAARQNVVACREYDKRHLDKFVGKKLSMRAYGIVLVSQGAMRILYGADAIRLSAYNLLIMPPHRLVSLCEHTYDSLVSLLLVDPVYYENTLNTDGNLRKVACHNGISDNIHIDVKSAKFIELQALFRQIEHTTNSSHAYRSDILRDYIHILQMYVAEMMSPKEPVTPDFRHKENIYKIFVHHAKLNFRKERQLRFYADKLSISQAYLSRTVKEVSGSTVLDYLSSLLFNEICRLLLSKDMTIAEIALQLNFSDPSALTNFFKGRAGCSPAAYRKSHAY